MRLLPAFTLVALLLLTPAMAHAHELTVLDPGGAQLDLGDASQPRLVHGTLAGTREELELGVRVRATPLRVLLLVPDAAPERGSDARPRLDESQRVDDRAISDETTGVEYLVVGERVLQPGPGAATTLRVTRGAEPTRVAVLVGDPDAAFAASDPSRTPRSMLRLRAWAETPADGSRPVRPAGSGPDRNAPWYGFGITLVAVLTAAWWLRIGHTRSRERSRDAG